MKDSGMLESMAQRHPQHCLATSCTNETSQRKRIQSFPSHSWTMREESKHMFRMINLQMDHNLLNRYKIDIGKVIIYQWTGLV